MRVPTMLMILIPLAGCAGGSGGPGRIPQGATAAMYTDLPVAAVARCFADAVGGTAQASGERFLVASAAAPGTTYDVGPNARGGIYPTEAILRGPRDPAEEQRVAACFAGASVG